MKYKEYSPIILRIGVSLVFLWFGLTNIFTPDNLIVYLPEFAFSLSIQPTTIMLINGIFETIFGSLLILGIFTRTSSLILSIHLLTIALTLGYNDIAIRDLGLTIATFAIFIHGKDKWCLDNRLKLLLPNFPKKPTN